METKTLTVQAVIYPDKKPLTLFIEELISNITELSLQGVVKYFEVMDLTNERRIVVGLTEETLEQNAKCPFDIDYVMMEVYKRLSKELKLNVTIALASKDKYTNLIVFNY